MKQLSKIMIFTVAAIIALASCKKEDPYVNVTGVSLDKSTLTLVEGESESLRATVNPSDADNKRVTWSSSSAAIASVDASGKVTASKAGSATITVTTEDGAKTATCNVTVTAAAISVTGVTLNKTTLSLFEGESEALIATIAPENATNKNLTWKSNSTATATVDANGKIVAVKAGSATITVTTEDGAKTATCTVEVKAKSVSVGEQEGTIKEDETGSVTFSVVVSGIPNGMYEIDWEGDNSISGMPAGIVLGNNWELNIVGGKGTLILITYGGGHKKGTYNLRLTIAGVTSEAFILTISEAPEKGVVINGITWATRNVDAPGTFTARMDIWGMFYQYNNQVGWSSTDPMRSSPSGQTWNRTGSESNGWRVVSDPCPEGWRLPVIAEIEALLTPNVTNTRGTNNRVEGRIFTDISNKNTLFLPLTGRRTGTNGILEDSGTHGSYWTSSPPSPNAGYLYVDSSSASRSNSTVTNAFSVRCVKK